MRKIFDELQHGRIDRTLFTSNANAYFDEQAVKDFASSLAPLATPQEFAQSGQSLRGGMTLRRYRIKFPNKTLRLTTFIMPDGKIEQYQIAAAEVAAFSKTAHVDNGRRSRTINREPTTRNCVR